MAKTQVCPGIFLSIRQLFLNLNPQYLYAVFLILCSFEFELAVVCVIRHYHHFASRRIENTIKELKSTLTIYDGNSLSNVPLSNVSDSYHFSLKSNHYKVEKFRNIGEEVEFLCPFHSETIWTKDGRRIEDGLLRYTRITDEYSATSSLHINFIREEDIGEYQCFTYTDFPNVIHKREVTHGTLQTTFYLKLRPIETKVHFVPWGNLLILTWPILRIHKNYQVQFNYYINNRWFSASQETVIHNECEYTGGTGLYLWYFQDTDPRLASPRYHYRNEFTFVSHCVQRDIYGVHSLEYSITLFNETTNKTSVHFMEHWMCYVVVPPDYQHVSHEDLTDVNFMAKHFHVMENLAIYDWYMYNWLMTKYEHISVWIWITVFGLGYYCICCQLLYPLFLIFARRYGRALDKSIKKHKCFVFCGDEDRNFVHQNIINVLRSNGVNVGFNHEVGDFNQIGRSNFENVSDILNNYEHIMIYLSNNYADDVHELEVLFFILSNLSRNKLTLVIDRYPSNESLRQIVQKLYAICQWTSHSCCLFSLIREIHMCMLWREYDRINVR